MKCSKIFSCFVILFCLAVFSPIAAEATETASGFCNDSKTISWTRSGSTLTISGSGEMEYMESIISTDNITHIVIEDGITKICALAFDNYEDLERVSFPDSLKYIGGDAFYGCENLSEAELPPNLEFLGAGAFAYCAIDHITFGQFVETIEDFTFAYCSNLTEVTIPDTITKIDERAFYYCTNIQTLTIGKNVTEIGRGAFNNLSNLKTLYWNAKEVPDFKSGNEVFRAAGQSGDGFSAYFGIDVTKIPSYIFYPNVDNLEQDNAYAPKLVSVSLPASLKSIGEHAFSDCRFLTDVSIPNGVVSIGEYAFSETAVPTFSLSKNVTSIGVAAFSQNRKLQEITVDAENPNYSSQDGVLFNKTKTMLYQYPSGNSRTSYTIPQTVTKLDSFCFSRSTNLTDIILPDGLEAIPRAAFDGCTGLTGITLPETVTALDFIAFRNCTGMRRCNLPEGITYIPSYCFQGCESLTDFTLHNKVTGIGESAFYQCFSLPEMIIPDTVETIGKSAFTYCKSMTRVVLPKNLTLIADWLFAHCNALKEIVLPDGITEIGDYAFFACNKMITITIPKSVTAIESRAFQSSSVRNVLYKGTVGDWNILMDSTGNYNDCLTSASKYCNYVDGTPIAGLYWNESGTFIIDAINCQDIEDSIAYLSFYNQDGALEHIFSADLIKNEVKYYRMDSAYNLTKGTASAMIWDKNTFVPLARNTTRSYQFKNDDDFIDIEVGGGTGGEIGGGTGGEVGGDAVIGGGTVGGGTNGEVGGYVVVGGGTVGGGTNRADNTGADIFISAEY